MQRLEPQFNSNSCGREPGFESGVSCLIAMTDLDNVRMCESPCGAVPACSATTGINSVFGWYIRDLSAWLSLSYYEINEHLVDLSGYGQCNTIQICVDAFRMTTMYTYACMYCTVDLLRSLLRRFIMVLAFNANSKPFLYAYSAFKEKKHAYSFMYGNINWTRCLLT